MFFSLIQKNSRNSRKENSLFFLSLIVSIVAFYIILSLENQDVMVFLKKMESNAVNHLFSLIPALYCVSLFILFFLVYFAEKYQFNRRSHEFGIYLMLGMKRGKLLIMLLAEEIWSSAVSLIVGLPIAIFLSEMISLITAKIIGLGIIGHQFTFSGKAVLGTIIGYLVIRLLALAIISGKAVRKEIDEMLSDKQDNKQKILNPYIAFVQFAAGLLLAVIALAMAVWGYAWISLFHMGASMVLGVSGVFLLFRGMAVIFELLFKKKDNKKRLGIFTFRQLQENVFLQSNSLAVSCLLIFLAVCCSGFGASVAMDLGDTGHKHTMDYTFQGEGRQIKSELKKSGASDYLEDIFEVKTGAFFTELDSEHEFLTDSLIEAIKDQKDSEEKAVLLNNMQYFTSPYLISVSDYNNILKLGGKPPIQLKDGEAALYCDSSYSNGILIRVLKQRPELVMDGIKYQLIPELYQENIVTDRTISISYGLIVADDLLLKLTDGNYSSYWNGVLKDEIVEETGLMQAIFKVNEQLSQTSLEYESYIQNIGRQLFYVVSSSYLTIYLAVIFLIIANTVIGVQFLMQQQKVGGRYQILKKLGCGYQMLCQSARKQIRWYFGLPLIIAAIGSLFGIRALFAGILVPGMQNNINSLLIVAIAIIFIIGMIEFIYIFLVVKMSDRYLMELVEGEL